MEPKLLSLPLMVMGLLLVIATEPFCWFFDMMVSYENEQEMTRTTIFAVLEAPPDANTLNTVMTEAGIAEWGEPPEDYALGILDILTTAQATWGISLPLTVSLQIGVVYTNTSVLDEYGTLGEQVPIYIIYDGPPPEAFGLNPGDRLVIACIGFELVPEGGDLVPLLNGEFQCADYVCPNETPQLGVDEPLCASGISPTPTPTSTPTPTATPDWGCCDRPIIPAPPLPANQEECLDYLSGGSCPFFSGWTQLPGEVCQPTGDCD